MDYEKKYKEALETARKINSGEGVAAPPDWTSYEVIFPELKESDDERIVRCLLNYFNHVRYNGLDLKGTDVDEVIAWLEKQGEKKPADKVEPKTLDADKVIEWLKITINERAENYGVYKATRLVLPYNSIEELINDFKEDFGLC